MCCFEEKYFLNFPKIIIVTWSSVSVRVFFIEDQDLQLRQEMERALNPPTKNWVLPLSFMSHPIPPLIADQILEKKIAFKQISPNILPLVHIFIFTIMTYLKSIIGIESLSTKQIPGELSPWITLLVFSMLLNMFPLLSSCLLPPPCMDCPTLPPNILLGETL